MDDDELQAELDRIAREMFDRALWNPEFRAPCGSCRQQEHGQCQRWSVVRVFQDKPERLDLPSLETRDELHICGCTCTTARQLQEMKAGEEC